MYEGSQASSQSSGVPSFRDSGLSALARSPATAAFMRTKPAPAPSSFSILPLSATPELYPRQHDHHGKRA
jgi:hypothetical protein